VLPFYFFSSVSFTNFRNPIAAYLAEIWDFLVIVACIIELIAAIQSLSDIDLNFEKFNI
jgi:hypothetical protein